ncbi:MAG: hypothetical protein A4E28_02740 [Methanocella sp. PtaU1.Bin125]|nr:MAG: hypothetical protein A4E28_02740 [Methanocella sp. PtaU1.Bin125]
MEDPLKKVAEQSINGKHGAPRFDTGALKFTEINDRFVTFHLDSHDVAVRIGDLTSEEAALAKLYYRVPAGPGRARDVAGGDDAPKAIGVGPGRSGLSENREPAGADKVGLTDGSRPDDRERLARRISAAKDWLGVPRFSYSKLRDVRIHGDTVTFYLESGPLAVPIDELNRSEASIAYDHYRPNDQPLREKNIGFIRRLDTPLVSPSYYIYHSRGIILMFGFLAAVWLLVIGVSVLNGIEAAPFNHDREIAISLARQNVDLQNYAGQKDVTIDYEASYYNPERLATTDQKSNYMRVQARVWIRHWTVGSTPDPHSQILSVEMYYIVVDLVNKRVVSAHHSTIV